LITFELVFTFWNRCGRFDDLVDELLRLIDLLFGVCHDQTVQVLFLIAGVSCVRSTLSFLDGAFAANSDFGARFGFHLLEGIATRSNE
jgi:hypothetical protein